MDARGNLYVAGTFIGPTATFGPISLTTQPVPGTPAASVQGYDLFVAKFNPAGTCRWAVQGDAVTHQNLTRNAALIYDGGGNLYVWGGYENTSVRIGGTVLPNRGPMLPQPIPLPPRPYTNNYAPDCFVARLDPLVRGTGPPSMGVLPLK